jgi:hypothetical protein
VKLWRTTHDTNAYVVVDLLHQGRAATVAGPDIARIVDAWLSELDIRTPLSQELARSACAGDWPRAHALGEHLSVAVCAA